MSRTIEEKIRHYCAYQERSHREVKYKLIELGVHGEEIDSITHDLIQENYLNEERYAIAYAGGKFRMKQWGKQKIIQGLKKQEISQYLINKALKEIPEKDYKAALKKSFDKKKKELKSEKNKFIKMTKIKNFLVSRGFGFEDINPLLKDF